MKLLPALLTTLCVTSITFIANALPNPNPNPNRRCPRDELATTPIAFGTARIDTTLRGNFTVAALGTQRTIAGAGGDTPEAIGGTLTFNLPTGSEVCRALLYWSGRNITPAQGLLVNGQAATVADLNPGEIFYKTLMVDVTAIARRSRSLNLETTDPAFTETLGFGLVVIYGSRSEPLTQITVIDGQFMGYEGCIHGRVEPYLEPDRLGFLVPEGDPGGSLNEQLLLNNRLVANSPFNGDSGNGFGFEAEIFDVSGYAPSNSHWAFFANPEPIDPSVCILSTR